MPTVKITDPSYISEHMFDKVVREKFQNNPDDADVRAQAITMLRMFRAGKTHDQVIADIMHAARSSRRGTNEEIAEIGFLMVAVGSSCWARYRTGEKLSVQPQSISAAWLVGVLINAEAPCSTSKIITFILLSFSFSCRSRSFGIRGLRQIAVKNRRLREFSEPLHSFPKDFGYEDQQRDFSTEQKREWKRGMINKNSG
jgi:hypothetical protein